MMAEEKIVLDTDEPFDDEDIVAKTARENFGIKYLYPWQRLVIANILEAYDYQQKNRQNQTENQDEIPEDSFCKGRQIVLLPTGAGKSLCFLIPASILEGQTMIIYPLLALMSDQQRRMEEGSLTSVTFRGGQTEEEREENFRRIKNGAKIILANPEVLQSQSLVERLKKVNIVHIAIDEAHCVSEWGDSFRPSYLNLGNLIEKLNPPLITAFTATASPPVLARVSEILFGGQAHVVRSESDRPNIRYRVIKSAAKEKAVIELAATQARPLVVFCGTRNRTEEMAREINLCLGAGSARFYHAGLEKSEKDETEKWFYNSKDGILVVTCAWGMGVDKKDVHTVVHLDPSPTAEAYIQEAGRGGRDGSVAQAILLWSPEDSLRASSYPKGSREAAMREFAETEDCRRQVLLDSLGAEQAWCAGCDLCDERNARVEAQNMKFFERRKFLKPYKKTLSDWEIAFKMIKKHKHFYTAESAEKELFEILNKKSLRLIGKKIWAHSDTAEIICQLEISGKIKKDGILWKDHYLASAGASPSAPS